MEFKITIEEEQKLLDRKMIKGELNFSEKSVPSRMQVLEAIAKKLKVDKTLIIVKEIKSIFGSTNATFEAHIYSSLDIKNKLEPKHLIKRNEIKVAEKKEEKKAEEKPAEAPKEEPKKVEEKPAEVPKKEEAPKEEKKVEASVEEKKE